MVHVRIERLLLQLLQNEAQREVGLPGQLVLLCQLFQLPQEAYRVSIGSQDTELGDNYVAPEGLYEARVLVSGAVEDGQTPLGETEGGSEFHIQLRVVEEGLIQLRGRLGGGGGLQTLEGSLDA